MRLESTGLCCAMCAAVTVLRRQDTMFEPQSCFCWEQRAAQHQAGCLRAGAPSSSNAGMLKRNHVLVVPASAGVLIPRRFAPNVPLLQVQRPGLKQLFDIDLDNLRRVAESLDRQDEATRDFKGIYQVPLLLMCTAQVYCALYF